MSTINYKTDYQTIDNHKLFYKYYKNGSPTVLFAAGLGDSSDTWQQIQDQISIVTTTLSYDRAGIGKSESTSTPRTALDIVKDLSKLLTKLSLKPPFILVGHSFGGLITRLFASLNLDLIVGMILIDATPENKEKHFQKILSPRKVENKKYLEKPRLNSEKIDKITTYRQICHYKRQFNFPLTIITRGLAQCYGNN